MYCTLEPPSAVVPEAPPAGEGRRSASGRAGRLAVTECGSEEALGGARGIVLVCADCGPSVCPFGGGWFPFQSTFRRFETVVIGVPTMTGTTLGFADPGGCSTSPAMSSLTVLVGFLSPGRFDAETGGGILGASSQRSRRDFGQSNARHVYFQSQPPSLGQGNRAESRNVQLSGGVA